MNIWRVRILVCAGVLLPLLAALCACQDSMVDPSLTFQAISGPEIEPGQGQVAQVVEGQEVRPYHWIELPRGSSYHGGGGSSGSAKGTGWFRAKRHIDFFWRGDEKELASFLEGLPALIRTHCERTGADWSAVSWEGGTFTLAYVEGPVHGSVSGHLMELEEDRDDSHRLTIEIEEGDSPVTATALSKEPARRLPR